MKAELPPLRFPALWLCVSSSSSPNCFSLPPSPSLPPLITVAVSQCQSLPLPLHPALTPVHPLFPSQVQGAERDHPRMC